MQDKTTITSQELDAIARTGLDHIKAYIGGDATVRDQAKMTLDAIRISGQKKSAENNNIKNILTVARAAGARPEQLQPLFQALVGEQISRIQAPMPMPEIAGPLSAGPASSASGSAKDK